MLAGCFQRLAKLRLVRSILRIKFGGALEFHQAARAILLKPQRHAKVKMRRRESHIQADGALEMLDRFGAAIQHGQQESHLVLNSSRLRIESGSLRVSRQGARRIALRLQRSGSGFHLLQRGGSRGNQGQSDN